MGEIVVRVHGPREEGCSRSVVEHVLGLCGGGCWALDVEFGITLGEGFERLVFWIVLVSLSA